MTVIRHYAGRKTLESLHKAKDLVVDAIGETNKLIKEEYDKQFKE